jgi:hypothetical protein
LRRLAAGPRRILEEGAVNHQHIKHIGREHNLGNFSCHGCRSRRTGPSLPRAAVVVIARLRRSRPGYRATVVVPCTRRMNAISGEQCDKFPGVAGKIRDDGRGTSMARPVMGRRNKVRVEFSLPAELAAEVYQRAREQNLTLSQTGERLLTHALSITDGPGSSLLHDVVSSDRNRGNV